MSGDCPVNYLFQQLSILQHIFVAFMKGEILSSIPSVKVLKMKSVNLQHFASYNNPFVVGSEHLVKELCFKLLISMV